MTMCHREEPDRDPVIKSYSQLFRYLRSGGRLRSNSTVHRKCGSSAGLSLAPEFRWMFRRLKRQ